MSETTSTTATPARSAPIVRRFQSYRGTWAWLIQRFSAIGLFLLIPIKIYTGWAADERVPYPKSIMSASNVHSASYLGQRIDIALLLFFLLHGFYGLRVILMDVGAIREDRWFWRTLTLALAIFSLAVWQVYVREH
jgi:succinate dehydrogenase/fumarate reductase cytochrome b subunit